MAQAVAGAVSGDTIQVAPGTYVISSFGDNDPGMTRIASGINLHTLTIEWEVPGVQPVIDLRAFALRDGSQGGRTVAIEAGPDNRNLTVRGLVLIGHPVGDSYGISSNSGYLPGVGFNGNPPSVLTIEYCKLVRWADGVKATIYNREITVNLRYSTIEDCTGNSLTHGVYMPASAALHILGCTFRTTLAGLSPPSNSAGHLVKSRARVTTVRGSLFDPVAGCASCIEAPSGGELTVEGNVILHYGQSSNANDNPAIKYGFEEAARRITLSVTGSMPTVGQRITNGSMAATVYAVGSNWIVYNVSSGTGLYGAGNTISVVGGSIVGTVLTSTGSPDGSSQDGRSHAIKIAQNTVRKDQPRDWSGSSATAIGMLWVSASMTTDAGSPLPPSAISTTVRNNIIGDAGCGARTLMDYPLNTAVARSSINDLGVYSGGNIAGDPAMNDAAYVWAGEFTLPTSRTDTRRGGR